jgi:hypothetical protein
VREITADQVVLSVPAAEAARHHWTTTEGS